MKTLAKYLLDHIPYIRNLRQQLEQYQTMYPPGHFYSPIVNTEELQSFRATLFSRKPDQLKGIELRKYAQFRLLQQFADYYKTIPFPARKDSSFRYYFENDLYSYGDAIVLHSMLRHFQPKRIIEAGSGFSSAAMLDTNEYFFDNSLQFTFIDPNPERLYSLLRDEDSSSATVLASRLQSVPLQEFEKLEKNDIFFVDSTHVSKTGSDVNYIFFEILPRLKSGVLIHFHDIFYPFEYPEEWVLGWKGFGWNESYMLRNFMMYNRDFEILFFNSFMHQNYPSWLAKNMPRFLHNPGGSIWLRKK
ncbi:class I SAM-dependent methyltransferase [Larkinella terrae]|uniref:Class I SAM-dependent methyltransferase n=1 Tax=Larkinella terrae TaxID=2025311 RepID=A0A7K0EMF3_9BACT|nr:class I SAM-dependent methyltransferase [Larkinella terrae]MRS62965.1 class I SAM-dependent methyltransferase [Larkinella terrae]